MKRTLDDMQEKAANLLANVEKTHADADHLHRVAEQSHRRAEELHEEVRQSRRRRAI